MLANSQGRSPRILCLGGPGDIIGTYKQWVRGVDDVREVSLSDSAQFYDLCRRLGADGYALSYHPNEDVFRDGRFVIEHKRVPMQSRSGLLFHLGWWSYVAGLAAKALDWKADVVIAGLGTHLSPLYRVYKTGTAVILYEECVLWPIKSGPSRFNRVVHRLDAPSFRTHAEAVMGFDHDIREQIEKLTAGRARPFAPFLPTYRRETFDSIARPQHVGNEFRVMYAGRVEADKGVFDLLESARRLARNSGRRVIFEICGEGSSLPELTRRARELGLGNGFVCHGHCTRERMRACFSRAHCVIAPTTAEFLEGLNRVVIEAVLSFRPVIASVVCPALKMVQPAALAVEPGDIDGYVAAVRLLRDDPVEFERRVEACQALREPFFDESNSWGAVAERLIVPALRRRGFQPVRETVDVHRLKGEPQHS